MSGFIITKDFLQMARKASTLVVRGVRKTTNPEYTGTVASMELIFRESTFGSKETGRMTYEEIPSVIQGMSERLAKCVTCIDFYWSLGTSNTLASVVAHVLKPGDFIELWWYRGAFQTEGLKGVGFTGDTLTLVVKRGVDKKHPSVMHFMIDSRICETDSSARMIQSGFGSER